MTKNSVSQSKILEASIWYEGGLYLWWSDLEAIRAVIIDLIDLSSRDATLDSYKSIANARLLLKELGER